MSARLREIPIMTTRQTTPAPSIRYGRSHINRTEEKLEKGHFGPFMTICWMDGMASHWGHISKFTTAKLFAWTFGAADWKRRKFLPEVVAVSRNPSASVLHLRAPPSLPPDGVNAIIILRQNAIMVSKARFNRRTKHFF